MKQEKKTLRPVPLSMRGKKRYILFELQSEVPLQKYDVTTSVIRVMNELYGSYGVAKFAIRFIDFDSSNGKGILRCAHNATDETKTGILFVKEIAGKKVIPKTLLTSGTIKKIRSVMG